jgi:hypothetical protein
MCMPKIKVVSVFVPVMRVEALTWRKVVSTIRVRLIETTREEGCSW